MKCSPDTAGAIGRTTSEEILESLVEGVAVFDRDFRLAYSNQNARFMLQLAHQRSEGLPLQEAFPREIAAGLSEALERALGGEAVLAHELTSRFAGGAEITLGITVSQLPPAPREAEGEGAMPVAPAAAAAASAAVPAAASEPEAAVEPSPSEEAETAATTSEAAAPSETAPVAEVEAEPDAEAKQAAGPDTPAEPKA